MRKPYRLLACLAPFFAVAVSPADGAAQDKLEPGVVNIAGPADSHFVDCQIP